MTRELAENQKIAQALIMAGEVTVSGKVITKPGTLVDESAELKLAEKLPYVSRGGIKLAHALDEFKLDVTSLTAMDVGASTGGFTDCLLQRGAKRVYAIDVGYGQLDYKLRQDPRVVVMERVNAHYPFSLPEKVNMATIDLSFISVTKVIPNVVDHLTQPGYIIVLFKPQFEAKKKRGGQRRHNQRPPGSRPRPRPLHRLGNRPRLKIARAGCLAHTRRRGQQGISHIFNSKPN